MSCEYASQMAIREAPEELSLINSIDLPIYSDYTKLCELSQQKKNYVFRVCVTMDVQFLSFSIEKTAHF